MDPPLRKHPKRRTYAMDQILVRDIIVMYYGVSYRIEISKAVVNNINKRVNEIKAFDV